MCILQVITYNFLTLTEVYILQVENLKINLNYATLQICNIGTLELWNFATLQHCYFATLQLAKLKNTGKKGKIGNT